MVGNSSGNICWPEYARCFKLFTTKSGGLNNIEGASHDDYLNGLIGRQGNNPLVCLNIENGSINAMGLPNPGHAAILNMILENNDEVPFKYSMFGQNDFEFKHGAELIKAHPAYRKISAIEINVSCPNTHCGETASTNELKPIYDRIKAVKEVIGNEKELVVKLSPLVDASDYVEIISEAGGNAITISNTIPGIAFNGYTGEKLLEGGVSGPIVLGRMLKNVSETYRKIKELGLDLKIYACGGISTKEDAERAVRAGADYIEMGTAFKGLNEHEIAFLVKDVINHLDSLGLIKGTDLVDSNPPYWFDDNAWELCGSERKLKVTSFDHKPYNVKEVISESSNASTVYFTEEIPHLIGQYIGAMIKINNRFEERPFTLSGLNCITVKDMGKTSHALINLKPGNQVYIRGPLGNGLELDCLGRILAIGGGCGAAAIAELVEKTGCDAILSFSKNCDVILEERLSDCLIMKHVDELNGGFLPVNKIKFNGYDSVVMCGPRPMMFASAKEAVIQGVKPESIYLIMESIFKCFSGLCGACDCGGIRLCTSGPIISYDKLLGRDFLVRGKDGAVNERVHL